MNESEARRIASEWHGGQWSALYSFSSAGYIRADLLAEISDCVPERAGDRAELAGLADFVRDEQTRRWAADAPCCTRYGIGRYSHNPDCVTQGNRP